MQALSHRQSKDHSKGRARIWHVCVVVNRRRRFDDACLPHCSPTRRMKVKDWIDMVSPGVLVIIVADRRQ
jgi:hypothetical protein